MWGGCHADHGVLSGNAGFEVKIVESFTFDDPQAKDVDGTDLTSISRFGWTVQDFLVKLFLKVTKYIHFVGFIAHTYDKLLKLHFLSLYFGGMDSVFYT